MKFVKAFGIAALAALATMAITAGTASAEATLCTNDVAYQDIAVCDGSHGKHVKVGTKIQAALAGGTSAVLTVTNADGSTNRVVTCTTSTAGGEITGTTGTAHISSLTFANCSSPNCTNVTATTPRTGKSFPWHVTVTPTSGTDGQMHVTGPSGKFTATCFFITATCEYEAATATPVVKGGTPAVIEANAIALNRVGGSEFICGAKADWTAKYNISTPSSLYVTGP
ncbi:MAG TPA: hypothetical protein VLI94_05795 [Solirubrobacterales bacterium]|nr:hypothetical protein [Solirubrobacterales bacterium]